MKRDWVADGDDSVGKLAAARGAALAVPAGAPQRSSTRNSACRGSRDSSRLMPGLDWWPATRLAEWRRDRTPTAFHPSAQGWRVRLPRVDDPKPANPEKVVARCGTARMQPLQGCHWFPSSTQGSAAGATLGCGIGTPLAFLGRVWWTGDLS